MNIQEILQNFKPYLTNRDNLTVAVVILVGVSSFFLGRISGEAYTPLKIDTQPAAIQTAESRTASPKEPEIQAEDPATVPFAGGYVGSKNGTKYHLPWCSGAQRINEENKIWFASKEEAERAGYTPALNCKGL